MDWTRYWDEFLYVYLGFKFQNGASGVPELLFFVATAACLIMLSWRLAVRRVLPAIRRRRRGTLPQCRTCGYPVEGLPTTTCPECGSDLRGRGTWLPTTVPPRLRPVNRLRRIVVWTLFIIIYYPFAVQLLPPLAPRPIVREMRNHFALPNRSNTQAGQRSISRCFIDAEWQTYLPFFIQPPVIYLEVWTDDWQYGQTTPSHMQARRMQIGPCSRSYGFVDGNGQWREGNNLNEQVILDFLQAAGVDPNDPSLLPTAKQLLPQLRRTSGLRFDWNPSPFGKKDKYHTWIHGDWVSLWLLGLLWILWQTRKLKLSTPVPDPAMQPAQAG